MLINLCALTFNAKVSSLKYQSLISVLFQCQIGTGWIETEMAGNRINQPDFLPTIEVWVLNGICTYFFLQWFFKNPDFFSVV